MKTHAQKIRRNKMLLEKVDKALLLAIATGNKQKQKLLFARREKLEIEAFNLASVE